MMKIKEKACFGCNGKGEYVLKLKYSKSPDIGPFKCDICKGTGKIKEGASK